MDYGYILHLRCPTARSCLEVKMKLETDGKGDLRNADLVTCWVFLGFSSLLLLEPIAKDAPTNFDRTRTSNDKVAKSSQLFDIFQRLIKSFTMPSGQGHRCKRASFQLCPVIETDDISRFVVCMAWQWNSLLTLPVVYVRGYAQSFIPMAHRFHAFHPLQGHIS